MFTKEPTFGLQTPVENPNFYYYSSYGKRKAKWIRQRTFSKKKLFGTNNLNNNWMKLNLNLILKKCDVNICIAKQNRYFWVNINAKHRHAHYTICCCTKTDLTAICSHFSPFHLLFWKISNLNDISISINSSGRENMEKTKKNMFALSMTTSDQLTHFLIFHFFELNVKRGKNTIIVNFYLNSFYFSFVFHLLFVFVFFILQYTAGTQAYPVICICTHYTAPSFYQFLLLERAVKMNDDGSKMFNSTFVDKEMFLKFEK